MNMGRVKLVWKAADSSSEVTGNTCAVPVPKQNSQSLVLVMQ